MSYTFAIVGALGNVGTEMQAILAESELPIEELVLMDLPAHAGRKVTWRDRELTVVAAAPEAFAGVDLALFSAGAGASLELAPAAVQRGCMVVDNSTAFRMDPEHPLVVPEVNPEDLAGHRGIIANPNCSTIQMVVALKPIHARWTIRRVVVSTYQAVSGSGAAAVEELENQARAFVADETPPVNFYPHQIAFNILPHIDSFLPSGYTKEEMKMVDETHKILDPAIGVTTTAVRVPVVSGHSESLNVETEKPFTLEAVREALAATEGIIVQDDPSANLYPLPLEAAGRNPVYVGRLRRDETLPNALNFWCVADNLRKGAALNTIQIAEALIARNLIRVP